MQERGFLFLRAPKEEVGLVAWEVATHPSPRDCELSAKRAISVCVVVWRVTLETHPCQVRG